MSAVLYHEAAEAEVLREIGYLELQARGLGRRFFGEIQRAEKLILRFPEAGPEILPGIRKRFLRKFRYSLIYCIEQGACSFWQWRTIAAAQTIGSGESVLEHFLIREELSRIATRVGS